MNLSLFNSFKRTRILDPRLTNNWVYASVIVYDIDLFYVSSNQTYLKRNACLL